VAFDKRVLKTLRKIKGKINDDSDGKNAQKSAGIPGIPQKIHEVQLHS
jgi:hypothetical protein